MIMKALREFSAIAIVRARDVDVGVWRRRLDKLEYPSVEFESLESLFSTIKSGRHFSAVFVPISELKDDLNNISIHGIQILLIVNNDEWSHSEIIIKRNSTLRNLHFINSDASDLEWMFRAQILLKIDNQEDKSEISSLISKAERNFSYKEYEISIFDRRILRKGYDICLKSREYDVAVLMFLNVGRILPRFWILKLVWGDAGIESRALDVCISRLREKLCLGGQNITLRSVYGKGYQLIDSGEPVKHHYGLDDIISGEWGRDEN